MSIRIDKIIAQSTIGCQASETLGGAGAPPSAPLRLDYRSRSAPPALVCAPSPWSALAPCSGCAYARAALACGRRACPARRLAPSGLCPALRCALGGAPAPCAYRATPLPFWIVFAPSPKQYGNMKAKNKNQKSNKKFTKPLPSPTILRKKKQKKSKNQKRHQVGRRGESDRATPKKTQ